MQAVNSLSHDSPWLSAEDAAALLKVRRSSLYSYVSRGLLRAQAMAGQRGKRYLQSDVLRLARQRQTVRNPASLAQSTLDWGQPVMASSLTLVQGGRLYYRGRDALQWAEHSSLEQTAEWMWQGVAFEPRPAVDHAAVAPPAGHRPASLPDFACILAAWHAQARPDQPQALLQAMATALLGAPSHESSQPAHEHLAQRWRLDAPGASSLRRALVLCADHELNASSFATRVVASTGASLQACLGAGLAALSGAMHGGVTRQIDRQWEAWHAHRTLAPSLALLLKHARSGHAPAGFTGFGHPLYPQGDPRAQAILQQLPPDPGRERLIDQVYAHAGLLPSLDYALVALQRGLRLPPGAAFAIFALGRTVGWIAHALEQRASGQLIRPRAVYSGPDPAADAGSSASASGSGRIVRFR